ncbi:hypothetical protein AMAG_03398 [Allomyces macrogynus ATCC 38327]|uniref:Uncharacterized protein n=1 Tax=Allomyces macrogynus (strain ATCC 38327) TaxID=578462 RepID=A0A0L0S9D4_ALLM3|nr:hypothetical protein AMAG_03398 [Allomyces macrogynus ATCC 38327]|eukprot:KNE59051.1 hypothetical protein AMAG_03398 [Allomyces macrogynus ATCC 38327]
MAAFLPGARPNGAGRDPPSSIAARAVLARDVHLILAQEAAVFPLPDPLQPTTVLKWTTKCPHFSRIYSTLRPAHQHESRDQEEVLAGTLICIVLHAHAWRRLALQGELAEADLVGEDVLVDAAALASANPSSTATSVDIGIHIYHIENTHRDAWASAVCAGTSPPLRERALQDLGAALRDLQHALRVPVQLVGVSALAVSLQGIHLTANVWNMVEPPVRADDYVVKYTDGSMALVALPTRHDFDAFLAKNRGQLAGTPLRTRMLYATPDMPSVLWQYLDPAPRSGHDALLVSADGVGPIVG